jgi:CO dehydrogenase/acetyl-CoA synthase beta subunit
MTERFLGGSTAGRQRGVVYNRLGPTGHLVAPMLVNAATHTVVPIVADFAGGAAAAMAGETAISTAAGTGMGILQVKFQRLQTSFTARRAGWLAGLLKEHLLGTLPEDLRDAALVPESEPFHEVEKFVKILECQLQGLVVSE